MTVNRRRAGLFRIAGWSKFPPLTLSRLGAYKTVACARRKGLCSGSRPAHI
jgi:hypothetical protein